MYENLALKIKQANTFHIFLEIRIRNRICNIDELFAKRSRDGLTMPFFRHC